MKKEEEEGEREGGREGREGEERYVMYNYKD